jgi:hypothetical protein
MQRTFVIFVLFSTVLATVLGGWALVSAAPCENPPMPTVTDKSVKQVPSMAQPAARTPYTDPVFGTCVMRVTDHEKDIASNDSSKGLKNEYSRVQSFNADESRILVRGTSASWYLYDANTLQPLGQLSIRGTDPRWDATDPAILYTSDGTRLMSYNVQTKEQKVVHDFAADFPGKKLQAVWTRYEGSPSIDSRYWGLMAEDENWNTVALLVYDKQADRVIATRETPPSDVDSVSISPRGDYFLAAFMNECNQTADAEHPCGTMVYDQSLKTGRSLGTHVGHGDFAFDTEGREVFVFQDSGTDYISMVDLATGNVTQLTPIDFSHTAISLHFSGRAFGKPGWALVSTTDDNATSFTWMDDQVFALELAANGRVVRLAHDHTLVDNKQEHDYWAEPHGSVNRNFTKVLFTSNWGQSGTEGVDMYMVALPANAITSKIGPIDTASAVSSSSATGIPGFEGAFALFALAAGASAALVMKRIRYR